MKKEGFFRINFIGLHVLLASVVLVFSVSVADQFALPKYAVLQAGSLVLLAWWLSWRLGAKQILIYRSGTDVMILFFLLVFGLSTIFSLNPTTSFFGKYHRYEGLLTQLSYLILFFLAVQLLNDDGVAWKHTKIMVSLAVLVSLYGLLQYAGYDLFSWRVLTGSVAGQSLSTFGNRGFLGGFLVIALPLSLSWFLSARDTEHWLAAISSLVIALTLVSTETRASWLAAAAGLLFFAFLNRKKIKPQRTSVMVVALLLLGLAVGFFVFGFQHSSKVKEIVWRASEIATLGGRSGAVRLEIWKASVRMTAARPILGTGPDAFRLLFTRFQSAQYARISEWQSIADDAHNYFLNLSSILGVLGLLAMTALLAALVWKGIKGVSSGSLLYDGFLSGVVGYLGHLFFTVGHLASNAWLWVILGILSAHLFPLKEKRLALGSVYRSSILVLAVLIALAGTIFAATRYFADFYFARGQEDIGAGQVFDAVENYNRAISLAPYYSGYQHELALLYIKLSTLRPDYDDLLRAVAIADQSIERDAHNVDGYMVLANAYLTGAERFGVREDAEEAAKVLAQALRVKPQSALTHFFLARAMLVQGEREGAKAHLRDALEIEPGYQSARKLLAEVNQEK